MKPDLNMVGKLVRKSFETNCENPPASYESMWILITGIDNDLYVGILKNEPVFIDNLYYDDKISFKPEEIIGTEHIDDLQMLVDDCEKLGINPYYD